MTAAPSPLAALIAEALPGVAVVVTAIPPEGKALVMWYDLTGEFITVMKYEGDTGPRPSICYRGHGATRFEWNTKAKKYMCVKCALAES